MLESIGVISGKDLTAEAAVTKAMFLLGNFTHNDVVKMLNQNLAGEITAE
jgi:L-asparaginase